jgi:hypothetical protein
MRSLYRAGSLVTILKKSKKKKLDLMRVQEIRWEGGGTEFAGEYTFFYRKRNENNELGTVFIIHERIISVVKRTEDVIHITEWSLVYYNCSEQSCPNRG